VDVSVNNRKTGGVEICVARLRPHDSSWVRSYPSLEEARKVLLAFGSSEELVDKHLQSPSEVGPKERIQFPSVDVPQRILWAHGFKI
jgi:hypothetical protein